MESIWFIMIDGTYNLRNQHKSPKAIGDLQYRGTLMGWIKWPYYPQSLSDAIPERKDINREQYISLLVSGMSEKIRRPITIIEPEISNQKFAHISPIRSEGNQIKLRRIDPINPRQNSEEICRLFRSIEENDLKCIDCDNKNVRDYFKVSSLRKQTSFKAYFCDRGLVELSGPIIIAGRKVAVLITGQFLSDNKDIEKIIELMMRDIKEISKLNDNPSLLKIENKLRNNGKKLSTQQEYMSLIQKQGIINDGISALEMLEKESLQLSHIIETEWKQGKKEKEAQFLENMEKIFLRKPRPKKMEDIFALSTEAISEIKQFLGIEYIVFFVTQPEQISFTPNPNLLKAFVFDGIESDIISGIKHLNWNKAHLYQHADDSLLLFPGPHISQCIDIQADEGQLRFKSGLKGKKSSFFLKSSTMITCFLSEQYRGIFLLGPFEENSSILNLEFEEPFLKDISEKIGVRILNQLKIMDSEAISIAWEDTATLLAHNARRGFFPVKDASGIIKSYILGENIYSKTNVLNAITSLEEVHEQLGHRSKLSIVKFAANVETAYDFQITDLASIMKACINLYSTIALKKGIIFEITPNFENLPAIYADKGKLEIAIGHLLDNAVKYSHPNKSVKIDGHETGQKVAIFVDDFGQGINEEDDYRIYEKGIQGKRSMKAEFEPGEGLGLYHSKLIAQAHGGNLWHECHSGSRDNQSRELEGFRVVFKMSLLKQKG